MKFLENKKILIIITGGIAAYKTLDLIRKLSKLNCEIKTILTKSGKEFVTPLSVTTLTKNKTFEDIFDKNSSLGQCDMRYRLFVLLHTKFHLFDNQIR